MAKNDLVLYGMKNCPKCEAVKELLEYNELTYEYCDDVEVMKKLGITEVPVVCKKSKPNKSTGSENGNKYYHNFQECVRMVAGLKGGK